MYNCLANTWASLTTYELPPKKEALSCCHPVLLGLVLSTSPADYPTGSSPNTPPHAKPAMGKIHSCLLLCLTVLPIQRMGMGILSHAGTTHPGAVRRKGQVRRQPSRRQHPCTTTARNASLESTCDFQSSLLHQIGNNEAPEEVQAQSMLMNESKTIIARFFMYRHKH